MIVVVSNLLASPFYVVVEKVLYKPIFHDEALGRNIWHYYVNVESTNKSQ